MRICEAVCQAVQQLVGAGVPEAEYDAWRMLSDVLWMDALLLRLKKQEELGVEDASRFFGMVSQRCGRTPLQYIEGETFFMGLRFAVTPSVLIPRQDTEVLCEEVLYHISDGQHVLDIGTGSGALAIAVKANRPGARVTAIDISADALAVAERNARMNGVSIEFLQGDCFSPVIGRKFDVILSNPPYIPSHQLDALMPEVRNEPRIALDGGPDGLEYYRRITMEAASHLKEGGLLLFEIGWDHKHAVCSMMREAIGEPYALRDYGGNWRVVGAEKRAVF